MDRLIKARKNGKFQQIVAPGTMRFLDFATLQLDKGERHSFRRARANMCSISFPAP